MFRGALVVNFWTDSLWLSDTIFSSVTPYSLLLKAFGRQYIAFVVVCHHLLESVGEKLTARWRKRRRVGGSKRVGSKRAASVFARLLFVYSVAARNPEVFAGFCHKQYPKPPHYTSILRWCFWLIAGSTLGLDQICYSTSQGALCPNLVNLTWIWPVSFARLTVYCTSFLVVWLVCGEHEQINYTTILRTFVEEL